MEHDELHEPEDSTMDVGETTSSALNAILHGKLEQKAYTEAQQKRSKVHEMSESEESDSDDNQREQDALEETDEPLEASSSLQFKQSALDEELGNYDNTDPESGKHDVERGNDVVTKEDGSRKRTAHELSESESSSEDEDALLVSSGESSEDDDDIEEMEVGVDDRPPSDGDADDSFTALADERLPSDEEEIEISDDDGEGPIIIGESAAHGKTQKSKKRVRRKRTMGGAGAQGDQDQLGKPKRKRRKKKEGDNEEKMKEKKKRKKSFERRNIRKIKEGEQLTAETIEAQEAEKERMKWLQEQRERMAAQQKEEMQNKKSELKLLLEAEDSLDSESKDTASALLSKARKETEDDSDDSDIIILPDEPKSPQQTEEDDYNNSGSHVNDDMNQPDKEGRVLVNVGHPPAEPDIHLAPQLGEAVKPHQIGGIRFLYDNLVESVERFKVSSGFGCILAHSMGLGKTLQMISFIDIFLRHTAGRLVLCIVPVNTLQNWLAEFNMWLPQEADPRVKEAPPGTISPRLFTVYCINDNHKTMAARGKVVDDWAHNGGVLLMGYEMYRLLTSKRVHSYGRSRKSKKPEVIDIEEEERNKELLSGLLDYLVRPGPDLVICDEGHRIKNSHASISQALKNIKTRRRVVLTGYPLQNNLLEYWCMVDFVRPNFLGTRTEFANMFERPITNGQCVDSTQQDVRLMRFRAHVLHSLLEGFVQRRGHTVLRSALPEKEEYVILAKMAPIQRQLYDTFINTLKEEHMEGWANTNPLKAFAVCCKIWNHPDVLHKIVQKKADDNDLDIDTTEDGNGNKKKGKGKSSSGTGSPSGNNGAANERFNQMLPAYMQDVGFSPFSAEKDSRTITYEWADKVMQDYTPGLKEHGGKISILFTILNSSISIGDKVLVFSQSLLTLNVIEEFLSKEDVPGTETKWAKNKSYFRLDGSTSAQDREKLINQFNDPENNTIQLFLLSTRAGCLGINLIGANRVVVFDASWNPCHDAQAVCRVYRYGQIKRCYIYRLVTDNTMEKKIYDRQINKQGMSDRVVDELQPKNQFTRKQTDTLLMYDDTDAESISPDLAENQDDPILCDVIKNNCRLIAKEPFTHESLLTDDRAGKLTRQEKKLAKQGYEMEKKLNVSYSRPSYAAFYPKSEPPRTFPRSGIAALATSRPVASVRPMMSTPPPMNMAGFHGPRPQGHSLPISSLLRPGVSVHQVKTTTDIYIPGTNTITQSGSSGRNKIPAGETVLVIKTPRGMYIRTNQGKIFAVRSGPRPGSGSSATDTNTGSGGAVTSTTNATSTVTSTSTGDSLSLSNLLGDGATNTGDLVGAGDRVGSLESLVERSESILDGMAREQGAQESSGSGPEQRGARDRPGNVGDEEDSDISIVGETPGTSSALDSLGNFSLGSLLGSDLGGSETVGGRGGSPRRSSSYPSNLSSVGSSHPMMPPPYGMPGSMPPWGYPMWNPSMSVPMPPSGPSMNPGDFFSSTKKSKRAQKDQESGDNKNEEDKDSGSDGEIQSSHMPPYMGMPPAPYGMPFPSYPYSYPYMAPPPHGAHTSTAPSGMPSYYPPPPAGMSYPVGGVSPNAGPVTSVSWGSIPSESSSPPNKEQNQDKHEEDKDTNE